MMVTNQTALAAHRFGLGARPGEIGRLGEPVAWLEAQVARPEAFRLAVPGLPSAHDAAVAFEAFRAAKQAEKAAPTPTPTPAGDGGGSFVEFVWPDLEARLVRAVTTDDGFAERLVWFWCNHFTVAATKAQTAPFVGPFEREAVRANLTGRFEDLLLATTRHPGMLVYLDQAGSVGPSSLAGQKAERGLNENLAREILELHTLGVHGGYAQADVTELARALTGWTLVSQKTRRFAGDRPTGTFVFVDAMHEPGPRTVLGTGYPEGGEEQATAILRALARHPSTARHVATKLARHFVADEPPAAAVERLERVFLDTGGDLSALHRALALLPEAWGATLQKRKSPADFVVSAMRTAGLETVDRKVAKALEDLGQAPFRASSPAGWPDTDAGWGGPDALVRRVAFAQLLAERVTLRERPEERFAGCLGPLWSPASDAAVRRAASGPQALVLGFLSPEFQRR